jgi:hypothetical protein
MTRPIAINWEISATTDDQRHQRSPSASNDTATVDEVAHA